MNGLIKSMLSSRIDYWIYGHSHRNIDRIIGNTQCVSNQLGYVNHGESESFDSKKSIPHLPSGL